MYTCTVCTVSIVSAERSFKIDDKYLNIYIDLESLYQMFDCFEDFVKSPKSFEFILLCNIIFLEYNTTFIYECAL